MTDYSHLKTGFCKLQTIAVNPDKDELEAILNEEVDNPSYTWEKNGVQNCILDFYLKNVYDEVYKMSLHLENKEVASNNKFKYINCVGDTQWVETESQLWDSMKNFEEIKSWISPNGKITEKYQKGSRPHEKEIIGDKQPRIAIKNEDILLEYRKHLLGANPYDSETYLYYNLQKLFDGDFSVLQKELDSSEYHFVGFIYVDSEFKQKVWKHFLPLGMLRELQENNVQYNRKLWENWKEQVTGNYGINGHYHFGKLQPFKEEFIKGKREISADGDDY